MSLWKNLTASERLAAVQTTAAGKNIEDRAVEKDWWVTAVLKALFNTSCRDYLLFKGLCVAIHNPLKASSEARKSSEKMSVSARVIMRSCSTFAISSQGTCLFQCVMADRGIIGRLFLFRY